MLIFLSGGLLLNCGNQIQINGHISKERERKKLIAQHFPMNRNPSQGPDHCLCLSSKEKKEEFDDSPVEQRSSEDGCLHDLMSEAMEESLDDLHDSVDAGDEV